MDEDDGSYIIRTESGEVVDYNISQKRWDNAVKDGQDIRKRAEIKFGVCSCDNVVTKECYNLEDPEFPHWSFLTHLKCEKLVPSKMANEFFHKYRSLDDYGDKLK